MQDDKHQTPPETPQPAQRPQSPGAADTPDALESYNRVAETVGLVPNLRLKDNLLQLVIVLVGLLIGAVVGYVLARQNGHAGQAALGFAALGAGLGFVLFGVLSGIVLMILGWVRAIRGWKKD